MFDSLLIIGCSLILLAYWFRYSCVLLLRNATEASSRVAEADSRFAVEQVRQQVLTAMELEPLEKLLERDYRLLVYLQDHAAGLGLHSMEDRLLVLDYRVLQYWYRLTRTIAPEFARRALAEMSDVLLVFVRRIAPEADLV
ncbi:MAG: hypothetical protein ABSH45_08430 [Bryobacteraceae bacterium]|jgi:hypothetical protein